MKKTAHFMGTCCCLLSVMLALNACQSEPVPLLPTVTVISTSVPTSISTPISISNPLERGVDEGHAMYYSGMGGIGMAMSPDGIKWTKYNDPAMPEIAFAKSDPVLKKTVAEDPNVQQSSWGWAMVYRYADMLNYAASDDGIHWTEMPDNPVISLLTKNIWFSSFVVHKNKAFLYFEAGGESTSPYLATWSETY